MTPQCSVNYHYNKEPLLNQQTPITFFNNNKNNNKKEKTRTKKLKRIKCVLVGDNAVGKSSLVGSYSRDDFHSNYIPTAYDNYDVEIQVDGKPVSMELCDTTGKDELDPLRSLCYPGSDVFLLCFSMVNPSSFYSAATRWANELSRHNGAIVLVGTMADLSNDPDILRRLRMNEQRPISDSEANSLAEKLNAPYILTSAKNGRVVKEAFDYAIAIALQNQRRKRGFWRKLSCIP